MAPTIPARNETGEHILSPGVSMEWKHDGRIIVFIFHSISQETIDIFLEASHQINVNWAVQEPMFQLHDLRFKGFSFTPYLRHKVQQIIDESVALGIQGRVALVLQAGMVTRVVQLFLRTIPLGSKFRTEVFVDIDKAMAWLLAPFSGKP